MFFKKKTLPADLSWLYADLHSHLLPAIDDGSQNMKTSVELIKGLSALGYKKLITTPHVLSEMYPNTSGIINNKAEELRRVIKEEGIAIELHAAAEYFIDDHFDRHLKNKLPLLTISGNMVLVEISMITAPMDLKEVLFEMQMQNYQPVIAHPERYIYLTRKKEFFDDLKTSGCMFQLNLLSLTGYYGESAQQLADYLLKKSYYDFAGSDLHNFKHLSLLQKFPSSQIKKLQGTGTIKNHLL